MKITFILLMLFALVGCRTPDGRSTAGRFSPGSAEQKLSKYDALLQRRENDEVIVPTEKTLNELQNLLGHGIIEYRSYRAQGAQDFYLNTMLVAGQNADRISTVYGTMTLAEAIDHAKASPSNELTQNVLRSSDGVEGFIYVAGVSANDGSSLGFMMPTNTAGVFLHVTANSVGFCGGQSTKIFENDFREMLLKFFEDARRIERMSSNKAAVRWESAVGESIPIPRS